MGDNFATSLTLQVILSIPLLDSPRKQSPRKRCPRSRASPTAGVAASTQGWVRSYSLFFHFSLLCLTRRMADGWEGIHLSRSLMVKNTETRQVQSVPQACSDDSEIEQTGVGRQVHVLDVFHTGPADRAGLQLGGAALAAHGVAAGTEGGVDLLLAAHHA